MIIWHTKQRVALACGILSGTWFVGRSRRHAALTVISVVMYRHISKGVIRKEFESDVEKV